MKTGFEIPVYAAFGVLTLVLVYEWLPARQAAVSVPAIVHATHTASPEGETAAKDTNTWAAAILHRPLFSATRRPSKAQGRAAQAASTGLPRLSGILITGNYKRAIFMPDGGKPMTLAEGATVDDYTIRHIAADRVVLSGAKGDMVLRPVYDPAHAGGTTVNAPLFGQAPNGNPIFPQGGFNPGFTPQLPPGFPQPNQPANASDDNNDGQTEPPRPGLPFPGIRGPFIPRGRS